MYEGWLQKGLGWSFRASLEAAMHSVKFRELVFQGPTGGGGVGRVSVRFLRGFG